jgi:hypothetical protein
MTLYSEYLRAAIPTPTTILGVRLQPYSLGHKLVLGRIGSPFEIGGAVAIHDIVLAVLICSQDYAGAIELLDRADLVELCERWALKVQTKGRWPFREFVPIDWPAKRKALDEYFEAHSKTPVYSVDEKNCGGGMEACPLVQVVKCELMGKLGLTEQQVLNRCWGLCLWDYITLKASTGALAMVDTYKEQELLAKAREADAA